VLFHAAVGKESLGKNNIIYLLSTWHF